MNNRYNYLISQKSNLSNEEKTSIKSDFTLFILTIKELFLYLVLLVPRIITTIILFPFNINKSKDYFKKIINGPFEILFNIFEWFFKAKYTASLILFLIIVFFIQIFYLEQVLDISQYIYSFYDILDGNFISIITSMFLHGSIAHLLGNCLFLLIFGRVVEKHFGGHIIWIFFFSAIIADLISGYLLYLFGDMTKSLGASGGISGLMIIAILLEPFTLSFALLIPLPIFIIAWLSIISDIFGLFTESTTNHLAHLGGYLALLLIFFFIGIRNKNKIIKGLIINLSILILTYILIKLLGIKYILNLLSFF